MAKYALVVTADERLLPGVHAMLNALKYYGAGDIEFHFLYWPSTKVSQFIDDMKASGHYDNLVPVDLSAIRKTQGEAEQPWKPVYYLKFYRSWYAGRLIDYDAVGFMDADRAITGDISPYFRLAHESKQIVMVDYRYSKSRLDSGFYDKYELQGTNGCPFDPSASFFTPAIWGRHFEKVRDYGKQLGRSEMPSLNYMLITHKLLEEIIRLPEDRWNIRRWGNVETDWCIRDNIRKLLITTTNEDRLYCKFRDKTEQDWQWQQVSDNVHEMLTIHGRWWFRETLQRKPAKKAQLDRASHFIVQNRNIANIWKVFKFFNFDCYTRLDPWMPEWGSYDEYIDPSTGLLLREGHGD